jgi:acyl dehydratase
MAFDLGSVGFETKTHTLTYDWKTLATYALGIGAKRDELAYLYEGTKDGIKAYPTFAVIAAFDTIVELMLKVGGDFATVVHGGQTIRSHRSMPPSGTIETQGTLKGIFDKSKFAQVVLETRSAIGGEPLFDTTWSLIYRGAGNFGGPPPPDTSDEPAAPEGRAPDWTVEDTTLPEQALLYRLSGDVNPLHADPDLAAKVGFREGPILHGLCTYGYAARAIIKKAAGGDASRLRLFSTQFRKPVWPGDTIVVQGWNLPGNKIAIVATTKSQSEPVLAHAWAEITPA